ncbi:hypothetical protein P4S72_10925 [Vibrio sp. PP-XX7]
MEVYVFKTENDSWYCHHRSHTTGVINFNDQLLFAINQLPRTDQTGNDNRNSFATTTKDAILSYDLASLEVLTAELMKNPDLVYVKIITPSGRVLSQAGDRKQLHRPFIQDHAVDQVSDGVFDIGAKIIEGGELFGTIQLGIDTTFMEQQIPDWLALESSYCNWRDGTGCALLLYSGVVSGWTSESIKSRRRSNFKRRDECIGHHVRLRRNLGSCPGV